MNEKRRAKILIATPAFGGLVTTQYLTSLLDTIAQFLIQGVPHSVYTIANESLISRGRNRCAQYALEHGFDKLFFIDADIGWAWPDVARLIKTDKLVIGGTYPLKQLDPMLNYNPMPETIDACMEKLKTKDTILRSPEELLVLSEMANDRGELEVRHIPTGFMIIDTRVFKSLQPHVPSFKMRDTENFQEKTYYDYFPVRVRDGVYESEDWAFCSLVREHLDCGVWLNTNVVTTHTGVITYTGARNV